MPPKPVTPDGACELCRGALQRPLHLLIPPLRAYLRLAPWRLGKRRLWTALVEPHLARHDRSFSARTVYGPRLKGNQRTLMQRCIYYFGTWEPALSRWIHATLAPGDTFVDVGANIGYFSLLAAFRLGPSGRVVALEPSPRVFAQLEANIALNGLSNVRTVPAAATAAEGSVPFYRAPLDDAESSTVPIPGHEREREVPAASLPSLLSEQELASTRVIKVDVEGAEACVLAGLVPALPHMRPDLEIAVEVHPHLLAITGISVSDLLEMLDPAGFVPYWLPVDFSPLGHLEPPSSLRPVRLAAPKDELVHMIFSRQRADRL